MTKTIFAALFIALVTFTTIACNRTSRPVEPAPAPAEAAVPAGDDVYGECTLHLPTEFIGGKTTGELRGTMPGMTWEQGIVVSDTDGDASTLEWTVSSMVVLEGTYEFTYTDSDGNWANYGSPRAISDADPTFRSMALCNWWDAESSSFQQKDHPHCTLRLKFRRVADEQSVSCHFVAAGNMGEFI